MREQLLGREISGCETLIMKVVWDSEEDISTPELIDELRTRFGKDYARTTVVTFLQRLAEKGFVKNCICSSTQVREGVYDQILKRGRSVLV